MNCANCGATPPENWFSPNYLIVHGYGNPNVSNTLTCCKCGGTKWNIVLNQAVSLPKADSLDGEEHF